MPADEFPEIPNQTDEEILSINAKVFADILEKVVFAAATDDSRPVLTGVLFESDGTKLSIVGVDGFRLSKHNITDVSLNGKYKEVIPARTLSEVMKTLREDEAEIVKIFRVKGNNQVLIKFKDIEFVSRLIEGEYPDYRQILPTDHVLSFDLDKAKLADAIKIINIFARDIVGNKTIMSVDTLNMKATLSASLAEVGGNDVTLDIVSVEGTDMQIAFSAKYLSDMISHLDVETLVFETNGAVAPGVFKEKGNEDFLHIIMPMRLD
jgi:DNA polymerase-3 subunit beta